MKIILYACFLAMSVFAASGNEGTDHATADFSLPSLHLSDKERVIGFEIHIQSGRIARLFDIPIGWEVCAHNDASWDTIVTGTFSTGATALSAAFFKHFMIVEKHASREKPFDVHGDVIVSEDFSTERHVNVSLKDFTVTTLTDASPAVSDD
jgi:hypothetical protein